MPRLSLLVPALGQTPADVRDCLARFLPADTQSAAGGLEAVVVLALGADPDKPLGDAAHDPRVRVVTVAAPGGPAEADGDDHLGAGLAAAAAAATGDYLLALDPARDRLLPDAVDALLARLDAVGDPDALLFDHETDHWWEGNLGPRLAARLAAAPDGSFGPDRCPDLVDPFLPRHAVLWRRAHLERADLRFEPGAVPGLRLTGVGLASAQRLAVLNRPCLVHSELRLPVPSARRGHAQFELLRRAEEMLDDAQRAGLPPALRGRLFESVVGEALRRLAGTAHLRTNERRPYFDRLHRLDRDHRPTGFHPPTGSLAAQYQLVHLGSFAAFSAARTTWRALDRATSVLPRRPQAPRTEQELGLAYYAEQLKLPVEEDLAVYSAYWGRGYSCNPAAIHAAAQRIAPHVRSAFLIAEPDAAAQMPPGVEPVLIGSRRYWEVMARAKFAFNNVNFEQAVQKREGTLHVQTQHGTPLKRMGIDQVSYRAAEAAAGNFNAMLTRVRRWDYNLSSNPHSTEVWERAFPGSYETLEYGYPRNDAFYTATAEDVLRLRRQFGIPDDKIAVLYAPTHRDYRAGFSAGMDLAALCDRLGDDFVVLLRAHHFYEGTDTVEALARSGRMIDLTSHRIPEDVCLAADVLVADYSSITFDFANLDRPMVIFADDWETYQATRGVYFDLLAAPPGPVARTQEELAEVFLSGAWNGPRSTELRRAFREKFCAFDDGRAGERVVRRVLLGEAPEDIAPPTPPGLRLPAPAVRF